MLYFLSFFFFPPAPCAVSLTALMNNSARRQRRASKIRARQISQRVPTVRTHNARDEYVAGRIMKMMRKLEEKRASERA